ncbi:MAG: PfkB family carbohydrate kinase, partial [Candidatus Omnitrophica bacterium]|nr:PfkB family carbohydrate kinase [Candidatus Omnitrophota bacterium]
REGIDIGGIVYDRTRPTTLKTRVIAHSQQVVRFDREKAEDISKEDLNKILRFVHDKIQTVDTVVIEDYGKGVVQPRLIKGIVRLARRFKKPVLVDPKEKNFPYYSGVTVITPNRNEAYQAMENGLGRHRQYTLEEVGRWLLKKYQLQAALITLGEEGMALFEKNGSVTQIPTTAREVYDVSGAGDTVIAILGLALATGAKMRDAAILSNLAAGIVVGKLGTAVVLPEELQCAVESLV